MLGKCKDCKTVTVCFLFEYLAFPFGAMFPNSNTGLQWREQMFTDKKYSFNIVCAINNTNVVGTLVLDRFDKRPLFESVLAAASIKT